MKNKRRLIVLLLTLAMVMSQMSFVAFAGTEAAGESDQTVTEQAAVETAFDQTVTENGVDITVKAAEGVFPSGAKLSAKKVDVPDVIDAENALAFDIKILVDGEEVQPKDNAKVEVSFKAAEVKKNETEVYHMDGSKADKLDVETKGTTATVETTGFSTYVLVFTSDNLTPTTGTGTYKYEMGSSDPVELNDILKGYKPTGTDKTGQYHFSFIKWLYDEAATPALSSDTNKIKIVKNGTGEQCVSVVSGATFDDGAGPYIKVPFSYQYSTDPSTTPASGTYHEDWTYVKVQITVRDTTAPGVIVEPTKKEGLIYDGSNQVLINAGSSEVGTMQYMVGTGAWTTSNEVTTITGKNQGDYTVNWRVKLDNGEIVKSGSVVATIKKKAATITIPGGSGAYTGQAIPAATAAGTLKYDGFVTGETPAINTDYTLSSDPSTIKEVGKYTINATAVDTSTLMKNYDLTIVPGTYTVTDKPSSQITYTVTNNNGSTTPASYIKDFEWVYDGAKHGIVVNVTAPETATVYYSRTILNAGNVATDGNTNPENVYPTDAGTYPIYFYIIADGYAPVAGSRTVKIDQAYLRVAVAPATKTVTYGDHVNYTNQSWTAALNAGNVTFNAYKEQAETNTLPVVTDSIGNLDKLAFDMGTYSGDMSDVGNYNIDLQNNLTSPNYVIRSTAGSLTVNPKPVTFTWSTPYEWTYDGKEHSVHAKINQSDLVGSDKETGKVTINYVDDQAAYTNSATNVLRDNNWAVDSYVAKVLSLDGPRGHNYTFAKTEDGKEKTDTSGNTDFKLFKINPVELTLTPDALEITYGDSPSDKQYSQTFTPSGLVNDEKIDDVLKGTPVQYWYGDYATPFNPETGKYVAGDSDVDKYDIFISNVVDAEATETVPKHNTKEGLHAQNYQVVSSVATDKLNVVQREIKNFNWIPKPTKFEYDGKFKTVTVVSVENDCEVGTTPANNSALYELTYSGSNNTQINADTYTTTAVLAQRAAKNYKLVDATNVLKWTIAKRPATIYVNSNSITYGQNPAYKGYSIDNKKVVDYNEETKKADKLADSITPTSSYKKNGKPGQYAIGVDIKGLNPNYYIAGVKQGTLTVSDRVGTLMAKGTKSGKKGILVSWNSVSGAVTYDVYMSLCNTKKKAYTPVYVGSTYGNSLKVTKIGKKKLKAKKPYKYYVVAKDASGNVIAQSELGHFITNNVKGKKVNAKSMTVNTHSVTIAKGGTAGLSASYTKAKKGKKYKLLDAWHSPLTRYVSENPAVATVDANGVVYGVGSGWTRVYVIGVSGMWETVEVNVQ